MSAIAPEDFAAFQIAMDGTPTEQEQPDVPDVFAPVTARALCLLPDPPESDQLLGPVVVRGQRFILGAHTGEGKTTMTLQTVKAITHGAEFLDWTGPGNCRALIIDVEQGLKTIKRRLREAGLEQSDAVDYLRVPDGLSLDSDDVQAAAVEQVIAAGDYGIVIADPLYKLHRGDSNDERAAVDLMRRFDAWREQYHFALGLPVHCRKPPIGAKFTMHEFFGSTAYLRGAEVVLGLQRVRDGYSRLHFFKDRDGDLPIGAQWGLLFDRERGFRRDPNDGAPKQTAQDKVRDLLEQQPDLTEVQLASAAECSDRTVRKALKALGAVDSRPGSTAEKLWNLPDDPKTGPNDDCRSEPHRNSFGIRNPSESPYGELLLPNETPPELDRNSATHPRTAPSGSCNPPIGEPTDGRAKGKFSSLTSPAADKKPGSSGGQRERRHRSHRVYPDARAALRPSRDAATGSRRRDQTDTATTQQAAPPTTRT